VDKAKFLARFLLIFFVFTRSFSSIKSEEIVYQSLRIFHPTSNIIKIIGEAGIPLDHISGKSGYYMDIVTTSDQTFVLEDQGIDLEILIQDMSKYFKERNIPAIQRDFPLGSMQGNYTLEELNNRFDELKELYPDIISEKLILGQSVEGRDIWAFKVSDSPDVDEDEPELLFTGLTHAREPLSMMNLIYFVQKLCEGYNSDQGMTYLVNNREIWFILIVNPDGYVFNESYQPNGGGMHRKNRFNTDCGDNTERGVDLNRNYGYGWGANNTGSSSNPCSDTYRGSSAFSEPETQVVKDFIEDHPLNSVFHYHSYGNYYIHPFGIGNLPQEPDLTTFRDIGQQIAEKNSYEVGTGLETVGYTVNGDAVDWTYGNQGIINFTPEVGTPNDSFWPSESRVVPLCANQVYPNTILSFISGNDIILRKIEFSDRIFLPGDSISISLFIQNRGLISSDGGITVGIEELNTLIELPNDSILIGTLDSRAIDTLSLDIYISNNADIGSETGCVVSVYDHSSFVRYDTISFFIGDPEFLFFDDFETGLGHWQIESDWGLTNFSYSGEWALSSSPNGDYENNQNTQIILDFDFNLIFFDGVNVSYRTNWDIELYDDFVQFQAYVPNNGWVNLYGEYSVPGSGQQGQPWNLPGYHGTSDGWVEENINLKQIGDLSPTKFRFMFTSDNYENADGFFIDDFTISGYSNIVSGDINMDFFIDIFDLIFLSDIVQSGNLDPSLIYLYDLDSNGIVNIFDIIYIIDQIMSF
tara:strand:- start:866 stop:3127 length:2262 start_codon:yes stop_codon:yes gene_type:complete